MKTILAVGAHPDDLEFSCAGTISKFIQEGSLVYYLIVSDGSKGNKKELAEEEIIKIRKAEQKKAAEILGVKEIFFLDIEDGKIENNDELKKEIVRIIRTILPDTIFSFDPDMRLYNLHVYHSDHRNTAMAVFDAASPRAGNVNFYKELNLRPHKISEFYFFGTKSPDVFIDITNHIDKKIDALLCHKSQLPNADKVKNFIKDIAKESGKNIDVEYAEKFKYIKRKI